MNLRTTQNRRNVQTESPSSSLLLLGGNWTISGKLYVMYPHGRRTGGAFDRLRKPSLVDLNWQKEIGLSENSVLAIVAGSAIQFVCLWNELVNRT